MYWWAFDEIKGWVQRDHFMVENAEANHRFYKSPDLDTNYGRQTTPEEVATTGGRLKKKIALR